MTKSVIVLFARESSSVARVIARLRAHFGARRVLAAPGQLPPSTEHAVIVALLSATEVVEGDAGGGLPLNQFSAWDSTGLDLALGSEQRVLPMLLDGAVMPAHTSIPEPFRKIAFKHALPIRCGAELDRDVGRLINDLEQHLQYSPAKAFAWDHWPDLSACTRYSRWRNTLSTDTCSFRLFRRFFLTGFFGPRVVLR